MGDWYEARVIGSSREATGLCELILDASGTPLPATHLHPGQYLKVALEGDGEGYFAIASTPGEQGHLELLVKSESRLGAALAALPPGARVKLSSPQGRGFPLEEAAGKDVLLFATGSGLAAIRPVVRLLLKDRSRYGALTLFVGVRTPDALAYIDELEAWEAAGVKVFRTVSQPGASGWQGLTGYVQAHLGEVEVNNAVAFLVGQPQMLEEVTAALKARGLSAEAVFRNA